MPMSLRRKLNQFYLPKTVNLSKRKSLRLLENGKRELLAADLVGGLADLAEGEGDPKVQMRLSLPIYRGSL